MSNSMVIFLLQCLCFELQPWKAKFSVKNMRMWQLSSSSPPLKFPFEYAFGIIFKDLSKPTLKYIWTNHLSKNNKGCALLGTKHQTYNIKSNNTIITTSNVCIPCSSTTIYLYGCALQQPSYWHSKL